MVHNPAGDKGPYPGARAVFLKTEYKQSMGVVVLCLSLACGIAIMASPASWLYIPPYEEWMDNQVPDFQVLSERDLGQFSKIDFERFPWVGVLWGHSPFTRCTAVLVAPQVVLSAGHCVDHPEWPENVRPQFTFILQQEGDVVSTQVGVRAMPVAVSHVSWAGANDWSVLVLDHPISEVKSFPSIEADIGYGKLIGKQLHILGYPLTHDGMKPLMIETCALDAIASPFTENQYVSICPSANGISGGPVFIEEEDGFTLVGVVAASVPHQGVKGILIQSTLQAKAWLRGLIEAGYKKNIWEYIDEKRRLGDPFLYQ